MRLDDLMTCSMLRFYVGVGSDIAFKFRSCLSGNDLKVWRKMPLNVPIDNVQSSTFTQEKFMKV